MDRHLLRQKVCQRILVIKTNTLCSQIIVILFYIYLKKFDVCLFVCGHSDVWLTSPPVLMLWGTQGYLWLSFDLTEVIK